MEARIGVGISVGMWDRMGISTLGLEPTWSFGKTCFALLRASLHRPVWLTDRPSFFPGLGPCTHFFCLVWR